jgi:hypothetical protein
MPRGANTPPTIDSQHPAKDGRHPFAGGNMKKIDYVELSLRQAQAVSALQRKGCTIIGAAIQNGMPLIEVDRPPMGGPAMKMVIRNSAGRVSRSVYACELNGCVVEAPARYAPDRGVAA